MRGTAGSADDDCALETWFGTSATVGRYGGRIASTFSGDLATVSKSTTAAIGHSAYSCCKSASAALPSLLAPRSSLLAGASSVTADLRLPLDPNHPRQAVTANIASAIAATRTQRVVARRW